MTENNIPEPSPRTAGQIDASMRGSSPDPGVPRERRFVFVQLLFSLAIAEVVRQVAELHSHKISDAVPAYTHLLLALLVIATSWMGWSTAAAVKEIRAERIFS